MVVEGARRCAQGQEGVGAAVLFTTKAIYANAVGKEEQSIAARMW